MEELEHRIKSVERGWGDDSRYFHTCPTWSLSTFVDEIKEEFKLVSPDCCISVYRGYVNGVLKFEMGINSDVTVIYY